MNTIEVYSRNVYGKQLIYPANEEGHKLVALLHSKTFSPEDLSKLKALGYKVTQVIDPRTEITGVRHD